MDFLRQIVTDIKTILAANAGSRRGKQVDRILRAVKDAKAPVIVLGDFNEPSFLDWTEKTKNMFEHNGVVLEWPSTKKLDDAGFKDAYRTFFKDEAKNPGITWPSQFLKKNKVTSWAPKSDDRDRLDYIFYKWGKAKVLKAAIVGPPGSYAYGKKTKDNTKNEVYLAKNLPWISDHKAIYAELEFSF